MIFVLLRIVTDYTGLEKALERGFKFPWFATGCIKCFNSHIFRDFSMHYKDFSSVNGLVKFKSYFL